MKKSSWEMVYTIQYKKFETTQDNGLWISNMQEWH